jgi:hypothetical protein
MILWRFGVQTEIAIVRRLERSLTYSLFIIHYSLFIIHYSLKLYSFGNPPLFIWKTNQLIQAKVKHISLVKESIKSNLFLWSVEATYTNPIDNYIN